MSEQRRKFDVVTLETLDLRVTSLEEGMHAVRKDMASAVREIQSNTALTEQIQGAIENLMEGHRDIKSDVAGVKADTASIVGVMKWASTTKRGAIALCIAVTALSSAMLGAIKLAHEFGWIK